MNRAFSTFEIKSVDEAQRIIEGIASTPSTDRTGDIVVSEGAKIALPLPFMWQHGKDAFVGMTPVGHVIAATPSKNGIPVRIQMAKSDRPGRLKDILDFVWDVVTKRLVRGLSIGFNPLGDPEPIKGTFGLRFPSWEMLEVSGVAIPANQDASITTVKAFCASALSSTDRTGARSSSPAAAGTLPKSGARMSPISEQLTAVTAELRTKSARLEELVALSGAEGGLEDEQSTELRALPETVEGLTARVSQLSAIEHAHAAIASPARTHLARLEVDVREHTPRVTFGDDQVAKAPPGIGLARAVICQMAALKGGYRNTPLELAKMHYRDDPRIAMYFKEDVPAGSTRDNLWAGSLVYNQNLASEFIEFLRPQTIIGRIPGLTRVPFNISVAGQTSGATGYWVGEGRAKPLTWFNTSRTTLGFYKVANIIAITEELARFSSPSAETLVRNELAASCQERIDRDFIDPDKAVSTGVSPASITNGIVNLNSAGNTLANAQTDLYNMLREFATNLTLPTTWIMSNQTAMALSLMLNSLGQRAFPGITPTGGDLLGLPVVTSQYAILGTPSNNLILLISAPDIFLADDGGFSIDVSREASLEMNDAPTMSSGPLGSPVGATGSVVVSMFQTNSVAIRCERFINWARKRSSAVVWMDDVNWAP